MTISPNDNPNKLRYDAGSGAYIVTYSEGTEEKFFSLNDAIWARDHDGEQPPSLWDILADLAEARAASQPDAYRRDSRGRFKGGEEKGW